jgi:hypothetical protein
MFHFNIFLKPIKPYSLTIVKFFTVFFPFSAEGALRNLQKILAPISHNVPAVYDVFAVAIMEREAFQQPQKCAGTKPHKGRRQTGVLWRPSRLLAAKRIQACYATFTPYHDFS